MQGRQSAQRPSPEHQSRAESLGAELPNALGFPRQSVRPDRLCSRIVQIIHMRIIIEPMYLIFLKIRSMSFAEPPKSLDNLRAMRKNSALDMLFTTLIRSCCIDTNLPGFSNLFFSRFDHLEPAAKRVITTFLVLLCWWRRPDPFPQIRNRIIKLHYVPFTLTKQFASTTRW